MAIEGDYDFGFSFTDEKEIFNKSPEIQQNLKWEERYNVLLGKFIDFLKSLKKNPEKDHIYWPNRIEKINQYIKHLERV